MKLSRVIGVLTILIFWFLLVGRQVMAAQTPVQDVAGSFTIADPGAVDGDIMVSSSSGLPAGRQGFVRTKLTYDSNIFGVLSDKPLVVFRVTDQAAKPIVRSGVTMVNVIGENGAIASGDYITSSSTLGKGTKASRSGQVLGVALGSLPAGRQVGRIPVAIKIEYADLTSTRNANRLFELLGASFLKNVQDPEKFGLIIRYIFAGLVLLASLSFGFITFSRAIPKGIEAIGRNPLAKNTIYFSMALNVGLIAIVGVLGIVGALLILRL